MNKSFRDSHGRLWFVMQTELVEIVEDQIIRYGAGDEIGHYPIASVIEDRQGKVLAANEREVFEFVAPAASTGRGSGKWPLTLQPDQGIDTMLSDSDDTLWIGTWHGLINLSLG